jgi:hypothetical protein
VGTEVTVTPVTEISFHSINVPSEWGLLNDCALVRYPQEVSIQLMSPASGDRMKSALALDIQTPFPFN